MDRKDFEEQLDRFNTIEDLLDELNDVVRGDAARNVTGLMVEMKEVHDFILKWERREYMVRGAFILLSSNIALTVLAIVAQFIVS